MDARERTRLFVARVPDADRILFVPLFLFSLSILGLFLPFSEQWELQNSVHLADESGLDQRFDGAFGGAEFDTCPLGEMFDRDRATVTSQSTISRAVVE